MLRTFALTPGGIEERNNGDGAVQVYLNPNEEERRRLVDELKIDAHTLLSALDPDELARVEIEPDHIAIIYKRPKSYTANDQFTFKTLSSGAFVFKDRLVLVVGDDAPLFTGKEFARPSSMVELTLRLIYRAIIHFREHLRIINQISDDLQTKIIKAMENSILLNMFTIEKSLEYYVNAINSNGNLIEKLKLHATRIGFTVEEMELLDDVMIENNQCARQAEIYSNILASLMDARASIVGNNLNMLMKTLNIVTIGIMVPTLVVSAFSMNVGIPLSSNPHAFWIVLAMALVSIAVFFLVWRRYKP